MTAKNDFIRKDWLPLLLILAGFGLGIYFYPVLPLKVPSHWNIYGQVDGYSSRFFGAFGLPLLNAGLYVLFLLTPYLDPKKANYKLFEGSYRMIRILMHVFLTGLQIVILSVAMGYDLNVAVIVKLSISVIFILIGNVMGRFKHNYFVGIKTPWTLASEEVWRKTHRVAAPIWVIGGIICAVMSLWNNGASAAVFFLMIVVLALVPIIYSFVLYKRISRQ